MNFENNNKRTPLLAEYLREEIEEEERRNQDQQQSTTTLSKAVGNAVAQYSAAAISYMFPASKPEQLKNASKTTSEKSNTGGDLNSVVPTYGTNVMSRK